MTTELDPRTLAAIHAPPMPPKLVQAAVEATQDQPGNLDRLRALITEWQVGLADALLDRLAAPNGPSRKELIAGIERLGSMEAMGDATGGVTHKTTKEWRELAARIDFARALLPPEPKP